MSVVYCFDSSSLLEASVRRYPQANFPGVWKQLDALVTAGRLIVSEQVRDDLKKKDDDIAGWIEERSDPLVQKIDAGQQTAVREILAAHSKLIQAGKQKNASDPWVIALAQTRNAVVVTEEGFGGVNQPRIPYVCQAVGLRVMKVLEVIQAERWEFK